MVRKGLIFFLLGICVVSLSGCATGRKKQNLENQGLRNQISVLEAQIQAKDEEINILREGLIKAAEVNAAQAAVKPAGRKKVIGEVKSRPNIKQIQIALTNAGYNPGPIDGKMGKATRQAIKAFQQANNLAADGKVGRKTWGLLREYLYQKIK